MASRDLNKVMLIGRLGQDPELKYTPSGVPVTSFTIATNLSWKDDSGNLQEKTDWHRIVAWRKLAEICNEYLKKGRKIYIEGRLQTRSFDDKDGQKRFITEVIANDMIMLETKEQTVNKVEAPITPEHTVTEDAVTEHDDLPF